MKIIDLKPPAQAGDNIFTKVKIAPLSFFKFSEITRETLSARTGKQRAESVMLRFRMKEQCTFVTAGDKELKLSAEEIYALPALAAVQINAELAGDEGQVGAILNDGNGFDTPIHYKFGTPLKAANGKEIAEVEFQAKTFGDVEDILSGDNQIYQAIDLITSLARPVDGSLLALPSWAIEQVSLADGLLIMNKVLPRFLG